MSDRLHVTEGTGNTVHIAYVTSEGAIGGTQCNREPFTINHRRRMFYRTGHPVTCKRCLQHAARTTTAAALTDLQNALRDFHEGRGPDNEVIHSIASAAEAFVASIYSKEI